jgi:hypothetical protein
MAAIDESDGVPIELVVDSAAVEAERLISEFSQRKHMTLEEAVALFRSFDRSLTAEDA